jgi:hypothetical protein
LKIGGRHLAIDLNFDVQASDPSDLDEFGIRLMPDKPQGYRPANAERIKAHVQTCGEFFATDVTFFDEETYTRMLSECGFGQVTFRRPQTWDLADCLSNPDDLARFQKYVATNPEMMAFSTVTV